MIPSALQLIWTWWEPGWIHDVVLPVGSQGLHPGSEVFYSVGDGSTWSSVLSFHAPEVPGVDRDAAFTWLMCVWMGLACLCVCLSPRTIISDHER
jgi:hypothetical protein